MAAAPCHPGCRRAAAVAAPAPLEHLQGAARGQRPELVAVARLQEAAQRARRIASWAWIPELSLRADYRIINDGADARGYTAAVSLGLPFFNRGQGVSTQADAALHSVTERSETLRDRIGGEVRAARQRLVGLLTERDRFAQVGFEHVDLLRRAIQTGFEGGERTLVELLDARRAAVAMARRGLALDLAVRLADVDLRRASGELQ